VDLSRLDSGALQMISEPTFTAMGACGWGSDMGLIARVADVHGHGRMQVGLGHGAHCSCRPYGVQVVAHAFARLWVCWADDDVGSFERGVYVTYGPFGIWPMCMLIRFCEGVC
jgi:hypothetical protein